MGKEPEFNLATVPQPVVRYWGRKLPRAVGKYVQRYSKKEETILDTFGGSGAIARTALSMNRRAIYMDWSPFATLIAKATISGCDPTTLVTAYGELIENKFVTIYKNNIKTDVDVSGLFSVYCDCGVKKEFARIIITKAYDVRRTSGTKLLGVQKNIFTFLQKNDAAIHHRVVNHLPKTQSDVVTRNLKSLVSKGYLRQYDVASRVIFLSKCKCGRTETKRLRWCMKRVRAYHWFPKDTLKYADGTPFYQGRGVATLDSLFMDRTLAYLSEMWRRIGFARISEDARDCLKVIFLSTASRCNKMRRTDGGTWPINSYWMPRVYMVVNPREALDRQARQFFAYAKTHRRFEEGPPAKVIGRKADISILNGDAKKRRLAPSSIDYAITDPPHTDQAQFGELGYFYNAWLKKKPDFSEEIVVNPRQGKDLDFYNESLTRVLYRIQSYVRPRRFITLILYKKDSPGILPKLKSQSARLGLAFVALESAGGYSVVTFRKTEGALSQEMSRAMRRVAAFPRKDYIVKGN
jgi:hypothetical protein